MTSDNIKFDLMAIKTMDELEKKFADVYGLDIDEEWWFEGYEDELNHYCNEWKRLHGIED